METKMIHPKDIETAIKGIKTGELIAFPTETVYGLGADATNENSVKKVYQAKGRPSDNPLIVHVSNREQIELFVESIPEKAINLMEQFWPGPLTLIFNLKENSGLSTTVTGGLKTAAFRMPNHPLTLELIEKSGKVLVGPSANTSGLPSPTTAKHVYEDLDGKIFGILDGGSCKVGLESTVVDMSDNLKLPMILRPGAITQSQLEQVIGEVEMDTHLVSEKEQPKAPGMKYKHYSPKTPVIMIDHQVDNWQEAIDFYQKQQHRVGLLINQEKLNQLERYETAYLLSAKKNVKEAMSNLFAGLRALDKEEISIILAETYDEKDEALAYMNRLKKASSGKIYL